MDVATNIREAVKAIERTLDKYPDGPHVNPVYRLLGVFNDIATTLAAREDGWVLVPREPTDEMIEAWWNHGGNGARADWTAMIAAAPPAQGDNT